MALGPTSTPLPPGAQSNTPMPQQQADVGSQIMQQIASGQARQVLQILRTPRGQQIVAQLPPQQQQAIARALKQALSAQQAQPQQAQPRGPSLPPGVLMP